MDTNRFELTLLLERKGTTIYREPILTTMPDEIMFAHQFKDVIVKGDNVIVRTKMHLEENQTLFSLNVNTLG